jgi:ATP-dependent RNA helicase MSS116
MLKQTIDEHCANEPNHKIMCFFTTARSTGLAAELFGKMRTDIVEIHSRKSQSARTKAADQFRAAKRAVMMSSDVTARGIDFPDVTLVIQIGVPSQREQYIHRLGRTARAGKSGEGIIILGPREDFFVRKEIGDLPVKIVNPAVDPDVAREVDAIMAKVDLKSKVQAYQAWLGYYKPFSRRMNWTPEQLVAEANHYAVDVLGCPEVPPILRKTVGNMGLKGVAGLNIVSELPEYGSSYGSKIGRQRRQG